VASATWEDLDTFRDKYPDFRLEDELNIEGGEMLCGATPTADADKIGNIFPIGNI
jgi:transcriptional regulator GlxA family with amidase domain